MTNEEMLKAKGWRKRPTATVYCWYHKDYPAAMFKLRDALDLARSQK